MTSMSRMSITLPEESMEKLRAEAEAAGVTQSEVIRRAIACYSFIVGETRRGRRLHSTNEDGTEPAQLILQI